MPSNWNDHLCTSHCPVHSLAGRVGAEAPNTSWPDWIFSPIDTLKQWVWYIVDETISYSVLPMSLVGGGAAIYYLRKTHRV